MKLKPWVRFILLIIILITIFTLCPNIYDRFKKITLNATQEVKKGVIKAVENIQDNTNSKKKQEEYNKCLNEIYKADELSADLKNDIKELDDYIKNHYNMSVKYQDIKTGFNYYYLPTQEYYAASTIKILDALYLYEKAASNTIDLDEKMTYTNKYIYSASKGMKNHKIGEKVSIRTLVKYAVIYSDNSAHQMLIDYIGYNNLKKYGQSLGATTTLVGGDNFGNLNAKDAIIYLEHVYDFIENNDELGKELKSYMLDAEENALKYDNLDSLVGHKYGHYSTYFHDIGIVYDENPYLIAILTNHGQNNYKNIVGDISEKINNLHLKFKENRQNICQNKIKN